MLMMSLFANFYPSARLSFRSRLRRYPCCVSGSTFTDQATSLFCFLLFLAQPSRAYFACRDLSYNRLSSMSYEELRWVRLHEKLQSGGPRCYHCACCLVVWSSIFNVTIIVQMLGSQEHPFTHTLRCRCTVSVWPRHCPELHQTADVVVSLRLALARETACGCSVVHTQYVNMFGRLLKPLSADLTAIELRLSWAADLLAYSTCKINQTHYASNDTWNDDELSSSLRVLAYTYARGLSCFRVLQSGRWHFLEPFLIRQPIERLRHGSITTFLSILHHYIYVMCISLGPIVCNSAVELHGPH